VQYSVEHALQKRNPGEGDFSVTCNTRFTGSVSSRFDVSGATDEGAGLLEPL
jgi:hypothetical protein